MCEQIRHKGRFITKRKFSWKTNLSIAAKQRKVEEAVTDEEAVFPVDGRRIVHIEELAKELWCYICDQPLSLKYIEKETITGLSSTFNVRCHNCFGLKAVRTNKELQKVSGVGKPSYDINLKASVAQIDSGIGASQLNTVLSALNIPTTNQWTMKRQERKVGAVIESVARNSCLESIREEKELTKDENPQSSMDNTIGIKSCFDGAWPKRGNGRTYNSLSGFGSLIGMKTGKVVAYGTRNKVCRLCEAGRGVDHHDCRKNWSGSAKAMEPDIAVEIIAKNNDLLAEKVVVDTLIGDDDSATIAAVRREAEHSIMKWSDLNHATKNLSKALWAAKINKNVIEYLKYCFGCAIKKNKDNVEATKAAIANIVPHAFDEHEKFGEWCRYKNDPINFKHNGLPNGKALQGQHLKDTLLGIMKTFYENADKLSPCGSSQSNESFNSVIASKAPKSHFYGSTDSYDFRVAAAVCQKNIGTSYINQVYEQLQLSPGQTGKRFREKKDAMRQNRALSAKRPEFKRRRLFLKKQRSKGNRSTERKEGITYSAGCGIHSMENVFDLPAKPNTAEGPTIFVDIETNGLSTKYAEICQLAAKWEDKEFNVYIIPTTGISHKISEITKLKIVNGQMFFKDKEVETKSKHDALNNFIDFIKSIGPSPILVAHNGIRFDFPIIIREIINCNLFDSFKDVVFGFVDSIKICKQVLPDRKKEKLKFNLECLIKDLLSDFVFTNAHNALGDVQALYTLLNNIGVPKSIFIDNCISVLTFLRCEQMSDEIKENSEVMSVMKTVSKHMVSKMAKSGLTLSHLQTAFVRSGDRGIELLLGEDVGGRPRVTKSKKIVKNIVLEVEKSFTLHHQSSDQSND